MNTNPATLAELREYLPGASSEFVLGQFESKASVSTALKAYQSQLIAENHSAKQRAGAVEVQRAALAERLSVGVDPADLHSAGSGSAGSSGSAFTTLVDSLIAGGMSRSDAVRQVARDHPGVHEDYVREHNRKHSGK